MNIYVGNLSYNITDEELREAFAAFGDVRSAKVIMDRETGRSKGFGFVEMDDSQQAEEAIRSLNGQDLKARPARVSEARPRQDRGFRG